MKAWTKAARTTGSRSTMRGRSARANSRSLICRANAALSAARRTAVRAARQPELPAARAAQRPAAGSKARSKPARAAAAAAAPAKRSKPRSAPGLHHRRCAAAGGPAASARSEQPERLRQWPAGPLPAASPPPPPPWSAQRRSGTAGRRSPGRFRDVASCPANAGHPVNAIPVIDRRLRLLDHPPSRMMTERVVRAAPPGDGASTGSSEGTRRRFSRRAGIAR